MMFYSEFSAMYPTFCTLWIKNIWNRLIPNNGLLNIFPVLLSAKDKPDNFTNALDKLITNDADEVHLFSS